jgi:hypothetical protein
MQRHPRTTIVTDRGIEAEAVAPVIISASRSTDIPAFYGSWFMKRLEAGYVRWVNPWNGRSSYVSLREVRLIVFWTKNPAPFLPHLREIEGSGIPYYFHFSLNDYEGENLEPGVPPLAERIATFRRLSDKIGRERVLWRFDPLVVTPSLSPERLLARIRTVGDNLTGYTDRLTIGFMTDYAKTQRNLRRAGIASTGWSGAEKTTFMVCLAEYLAGRNISGVTCAEESNNGESGITAGKCIDDRLARSLWGNDRRLADFLDVYANSKDTGQRKGCRCLPAKDIGRYDTCGHACRYCYANSSPQAALARCGRASDDAEAIID